MSTTHFSRTSRFSPALLVPLTVFALFLMRAAGADAKTVVPKFPTAKSAAVLSKQVCDYDTHLKLAQTTGAKGMDLAFAKNDVNQDIKSAALAGDVAKAKALQSKYEKMAAQEDGLNGTMTKQMAQALGLYRAITASRLYAGHYTQTTVALSPGAVNGYITDMGADHLKFIKPK